METDVVKTKPSFTFSEETIVGAETESKKEMMVKELKFLEQQNGKLKPEDVVEYARDITSALHNRFTWDDSVAGYQWRLQQARQIISTVYVTVENRGKQVETRAWVNVDTRDGSERGYVSIQRALVNDNWREALLRDARTEMKHFRQKYSQLTELSSVIAAIDELDDD